MSNSFEDAFDDGPIDPSLLRGGAKDTGANPRRNVPRSTGRGVTPPPAKSRESPTDPVLQRWGPDAELTTWNGRDRIVRVVLDKVSYVSPPPEVQKLRWAARPEEPQIFEMPWKGSDPTKLETLETLGESLRVAPPRGSGDARLDVLNRAFAQLLNVAAGLHEQGWMLGLIAPDSVVIWPDADGEIRLILPSLGYVWEPIAKEDEVHAPRWARTTWKYAPIWTPDTPRERLRKTFPPDDQPLAPVEDPGPDLSALARVFACVLDDGRPLGSVPSLGRTMSLGDGGAPRRLGRRARVWKVLRDADQGLYSSAAELAAALSGAPPSDYYLEPSLPPTPPAPPVRPVRWIAAGLVSIALIFTALVLFTPAKPDPRVPGKDTTLDPGNRPVVPSSLLANFDAGLVAFDAERETVSRGELLAKLEVTLLAIGREGSENQSSSPELESRHKEFLSRWMTLRDAVDQLPADKFDVHVRMREDLRSALDRLRSLPANDDLKKEERACRDALH